MPAPPEKQDPTFAQAQERARVALSWLRGDYVEQNNYRVDYSGAPIPFIVTGHPPATAAAVVDVLKPSFRVLEQMSRGKIVVEDHWGASVHRDRDGVAALRDGRSHLAPIYSGWDAGAYKLAQGLQLPGLFPDSGTGTLIAGELYGKYFRSDVERQGILMGRMKASGAYHLFSMKPLHGVADLRGLRIGTTEGIEPEVMRALGAEPVALSSLEMNPALSQGRIDAMHLSDGSCEVFGIGKIARYRVAFGLVHQSLEFGLSKNFWDALPRDLQIILSAWLRAEAQAETQVFYGVAGARARERFKAGGMEFIYWSAQEYERLLGLTRPVVDAFAESEEAEGRPARAMLQDIENLKIRHRDKTPNDLMREAIFEPVQGICG